MIEIIDKYMEGYEVQNLDKKNARQIIFKTQLTTHKYI